MFPYFPTSASLWCYTPSHLPIIRTHTPHPPWIFVGMSPLPNHCLTAWHRSVGEEYWVVVGLAVVEGGSMTIVTQTLRRILLLILVPILILITKTTTGISSLSSPTTPPCLDTRRSSDLWVSRQHMGGLETYNGVPTPAEWWRSAPNNGSISFFWRGYYNKGIGLASEYFTRDWRWRKLGAARMLSRTGGQNNLEVMEEKREVGANSKEEKLRYGK